MDIAYSRPRFRTDLVAKPFDEAGQRFVDVTDPDSGKTFRFYEIEYSIACAMDGRRDLAGLAEWAHAELGVEPSRDELATVISTLDDLGYLEQGVSARPGFDLGTAGAASDDDDAEEALASGDEFELGNAGKSPLDLSDEERLDAPELTLGVSGNELVEVGPGELPASAGSDYDDSPTTIKKVGNLRDLGSELGDSLSSQIEPTAVQPVLRPVARARTGDEEGPTNIPPPVADFDEEVSVDLTDHMRIGAADVKEAVRQSKVMQAVEIPPELEQRLTRGATAEDDDDGSATTEHEAPRLAPPPGPLPRMQTPPPVRSSTAAPTELPEVPAFLNQATPLDEDSGRVGSAFRAERSESAPVVVEKKSRVGLLLAILLVVGLGAGAAYYFLMYLPAQQGATVTPQPVTPDPEPTAPEPLPSPARPSARLAATPVDPVPVTASVDGEIKEILAAGAEVSENDIVVKLAGFEAAQRKIDDLMSDVDRYQKRIAAAEEKKQKAEVASAGSGERYQKEIERDQEKIADREQDAEAARKEMEPYLVRAPISGKIATERATGQKVAAGDTVFSIELPPRLQAVFTVETGELPGKHAEVKLAAKADESKAGTCRVAEIKEREITVICPGAEPFADGAEVVLLQ
jgi:biotin carboxyl carrier protein